MYKHTGLELDVIALGFTSLAGLDEAGRGPLAGPVVASAVIFNPGTELMGIDDSKKLTHGERERLSSLIMERAAGIGIGIASHVEIDCINILQASILAMHRAVEHLPVPPSYLLVDGNSFHHPALPFRTIVKGDSKCFTIAAASIVAKVERDKLMQKYHKQYPEYGFDANKGYPTKQHIEAIRKHGYSPIHRKSFIVKQLVQTEAFGDE